MAWAAPTWADEAELKTPTDRIVASFMALDIDEDEVVDYAEYLMMVEQRARQRFESMDSNHDEYVTDEEYRQFWAREKAMYYRLQR